MDVSIIATHYRVPRQTAWVYIVFSRETRIRIRIFIKFFLDGVRHSEMRRIFFSSSYSGRARLVRADKKRALGVERSNRERLTTRVRNTRNGEER